MSEVNGICTEYVGGNPNSDQILKENRPTSMIRKLTESVINFLEFAGSSVIRWEDAGAGKVIRIPNRCQQFAHGFQEQPSTPFMMFGGNLSFEEEFINNWWPFPNHVRIKVTAKGCSNSKIIDQELRETRDATPLDC